MMPLVNISLLRDIDIKILKATGCEIVPIDPDDYKLIISLDNRTFYGIPS